jgi:hypothetical protein
VARVSRSGKKTQILITMLVERDCREICRGWETQGVAAPKGKP